MRNITHDTQGGEVTIQQSERCGWYNFVTGKHDTLEGMPEDLAPYLPQYPEAQAIFKINLEMGMPAQEAFLDAMSRLIPKEG